MGRNHEVITEQFLLDENGELREPGWSRRMVQKYRRDMIKAPKWRIKEWDYYLVLSDQFGVAFTISDDGYIGLQSASLLLFGEKAWEHTETVLNAFPMGKLHLPEDSSDGITEYKDKRLHMRFSAGNGSRRIQCLFRNFHEGKNLKCDITLRQPDMDSMVIATPWDQKHAFYYNQKINCMRASGYVMYDGKRYEFNPEKDFGTLDWDPWKFTSSDGRFEMDFVPVLDRAADLDFKLIVSDQHQVFGRMSGTAVLDDGTAVQIKDVLCFAEKVHNRY